MTTTSRHHRPSPTLLPVVGAALVGAALGAGAVAIASPTPPTQPAAAPPASNTVPANTASNKALPPPADTVRPVDPIAFSPPITDAAGMSMTVLRPEKVKGGVRLTIALVNTNDVPITVDTGAVGPHDPRFNNVSVPMTMTPAVKRLVPGEGYTYQCVFKLPTMDVGHLSFVVGTASITGPAAGD
ncbi:MAG: hypothetical protein JO287_27185 [Pseudonocardiales bacterium]|nr:hypothetical protein [Pseudonocardiales bacterium]